MTNNNYRGKKFSRMSYGEIVAVEADAYVVRNEQGVEWTIPAHLVDDEFAINDNSATESTITATELASLFASNPHVICTVNYNKKVNRTDVKAKMNDLYANKNGIILSEAQYQRKVSRALNGIVNGVERTMIGRHHGHVDEFGRVQFVDMQAERDETKAYDTRLRKVDPRTINWLIINNIKYKLR